MPAYTRTPQRFVYGGISLLPADLLAALGNKYPFGQNIRSYQEGTIQPREGLTVVTSGALAGGAIHSLWRLDDPTSFAPAPAMRYLGAGVALYARAPGAGAYPQIDTGYSGNPLSFVNASPVRSPQPWVYIGDGSRMRKVNTGNTVYPVGIAQPSGPTTAPSITLGAPGVTVISDLDVAGDWATVGAIAAAPTNVAPVNTTIGTIVYDSGNTGYASINAASMTNIHPGTRLALAGAETVLVTDVLPAIASTTIAAIIYDSGTTGLCTIQPTASISLGQLEGPLFDEWVRRYHPAWLKESTAAPASLLARVRQIDFPVNCLVRINSGGGSDETVRIVSVAVGKDGIQSFRCSTANTHAAAETLSGVSCFRAFTTGTRASGNTVVGNAIQQVLTPTTVDPVVGGIQDTTLPLDLSLVGGRATQPEDELWLSIKVDTLNYVQEVRVYLDVDAATTDFLRNYFMYAWRANDIISAIHATNTSVPTTVQTAREDAVLQNQIDQAVIDDVRMPTDQDGPPVNERLYPAPPSPTDQGRSVALTATSQQLALGNNQWITLKAKIRDLVHVGTDLTRTLAGVGGVEVLFTLAGTTSAVTVQYDSALITGGYGPDVGDTGQPYVYGYRYRSSATGAYSNMSPPSRGGVVPRRQRVTGTATASGDAQADLIDWFRYGGGLTRWTYVMTASALTDDVLDSAIEGGEAPEESYQPWPTSDLPRSGTCNVSGTAVSRVAGDTFNTSWAPGTVITVNGVTTTLYAAPASTSLLHVVANCGSGAAVAWSIREPLLLSQNLPAHWGGPVQNVVFLFACGDPTDPGALHWTIGNNPDATRDRNWLAITNASEPLQHGFVYDGVPFVFSTDQLYRIVATFGSANPFRADATACRKGLWNRWGFAVAPEGCYFIAKDGIYLTAFGAPAVSITDPDLSEIFPHDGAAGRTVNGIVPPDMTATTRLRLSIVDRFLYFDYANTSGQDRTLVYDRLAKTWTPDVYALSGIRSRFSEPGAQVEDHLLGAANGHLYQMSQTAFADDGTAIAWQVYTPWPDAGEPRVEKFYGDLILDYDMRNAGQNLSVVVVYNDAVSSLAAQTFGGGSNGRRQTAIDLQSGAGVLARNIGLQITGSSVAADGNRPLLYLWEPAFVRKVELTELRPTDWLDGGYPGVKQVRGAIVRANTLNAAKGFKIQRSSTAGPVDAVVGLTITSNGESKTPFAFTPFYAHQMRLLPTDEVPWLVFDEDLQWIVDEKPELTAQYTDWEDAGIVGTKQVRGLELHVDTGGAGPVSVQVQSDNGTVSATISLTASTGEDGQHFSFNPPFYADVLRLVPLGAVRILAKRWIADPKPSLVRLYTDWTDDSYVGTKFMQGIVLHVDTNGVAGVQVEVQYDNGAVGATLTLDASTGEDGQPFSFSTPFLAHVLRLVPLGNVRILKWRYVWEPAPELATRWQTQPTTHDLPGYLSVRDLVVAHQSTADLTLTIAYENGQTDTYTIAHGSGAYRRSYVPCEAGKGRAVTYTFTSSAGFRLFKRDMSCRIQGWGVPGGYLQTTPFGGPSRLSGAEI